MTLLTLCWEFFKTGLFAIGGGLATLPFLTDMSLRHPDWFSQEMLANMVAISESTPGPIGVNMATYVGYTTAGMLGGLLATLSLVLPSLIIIITISHFISHYKDNPLLQRTFATLHPVVTGLIAAAGYQVLRMAIWPLSGSINWIGAIMLVVLLALTQWKKLAKVHPALYLLVGAGLGIMFRLS